MVQLATSSLELKLMEYPPLSSNAASPCVLENRPFTSMIFPARKPVFIGFSHCHVWLLEGDLNSYIAAGCQILEI